MTCTHKTLLDHTAPWDGKNRRVWICSSCGRHGLWEEGWAYLGNIECRTCQTAQIDSVACPNCKLPADEPPRPGRKARVERPAQPAKPLPCPFCGGAPIVKSDGDYHYVRCEGVRCEVLPSITDDDSQASAVGRWNRRRA